MANMQNYINYIADPRARRSIRSILSTFLNDDLTFKGMTFGSAVTPLSVAGAFTTGLSISGDGTTGISVTSGFTGVTGISFAGTASSDGILISGACADAIHISGTNTVSGLHISGDQVLSILIDVDAAVTAAMQVKVDDSMTADYGIDISRTGTTGICTTGIRIDTDGTTAIDITSGFTGTTGILFAGTATNGISLTGACATAAISISGAEAIGLSILTSTPTDGINIAAACANGIAIGGANTTAAINITGAEAAGIIISTSTPTNGIQISSACANGISISGANTAAALAISGANAATGILMTGVWGSSANYGAITIAGDAAGTALALGASATSFLGLRIDLTAAVTAGNDFMAIHSELETSGAMADGFIIGMYQRVRVAHVAYENYAIWGRMDVNVAQTGDTGNQYLGVFGAVNFAAGAHALLATGGGYGVLGTASIATGGTLDQPLIGGYFECNAVDNIAGLTTASRHRMLGYCDYGADVLCQTSNGTGGVRVMATDAAILPYGLELDASATGGQSTINHAIHFNNTDGRDACLVATITFDATADGMIKVDVGGTDYYIPIWDAAGLDNEWADWS